VKTIVSTSNNTLAKGTADNSTNTAFEKYCQYQYQYICESQSQQRSFFSRSSINNKMTAVEKMFIE